MECGKGLTLTVDDIPDPFTVSPVLFTGKLKHNIGAFADKKQEKT